MKKMKITIYKDGTQKVEALTCGGPDCIALTEAYEKRAGIQIGERVLKPEYYEEPVYDSETVREIEKG